jgi:hypothetical protein
MIKVSLETIVFLVLALIALVALVVYAPAKIAPMFSDAIKPKAVTVTL